MGVASFAAVSTVTPRGDGRYGIDISPGWTIVGKPNGGYLMAMLGRAAVEAAAAATSTSTTGAAADASATGNALRPHVVAASAHYLRSPEPGPAWITTTVLRLGRSASQLRCRLHQGEYVCAEALVTVGHRSEAAGGYEWSAVTVPAVAAWADCVRLPSTGPGGMAVTIMDQIELRMDPATLGFAAGRPSGRGRLAGWLALPGGADFDDVSLLMALDCFPPATFDVGPSGWVPTLEFTTYVRARPAPGPVQVQQQAGVIEGDLVDETCLIWDSTGHLVAQGTQLAGIRMHAAPAAGR